LATGDLQDPVVEELEKLKITVFICNPESLNQLFSVIKTIGNITGKAAEAKTLNDTMKGIKNKVTKKVAKLEESEKPKVFFELYNEPLTTIGRDTFHNELIETAGGKNITGHLGEKYPQYSLEALLIEDPDVYLAISDSMYNPGDIKERPAYANMAAIKNDQVAVINGDLVNRAGPRITSGLWEIAKAIHPDLFK
jgi:iron complex transport system substrate-binding protein